MELPTTARESMGDDLEQQEQQQHQQQHQQHHHQQGDGNSSDKNSASLSWFDTLMSPLVNLFLMFFGLSIFTIRNHTDFDILVTPNFPKSCSIFHEESTVHDWDIYVIRKGECQFFTIAISFGSLSRPLFYMLSGMPIAVKKGFSLIPGRIDVSEISGDHNISFRSERCSIAVAKCAFAANNMKTKDDLEDVDRLKTSKKGENSSDAVVKAAVHSIDEDESFKISLLYFHGHSCKRAIYETGLRREESVVFKSKENCVCDLESAVVKDKVKRVAEVAFPMKFEIECSNIEESASKEWYDSEERFQSALYMKHHFADISYIKQYARRVVDVYNEYGLLVIEAFQADPAVLNVAILALTSITISLGNGGRGYPVSKPGKEWFGAGIDNELKLGEKLNYYNNLNKAGPKCKKENEKKYYLENSMQVDSIFRASVPLLLTSLINLSVLGSPTEKGRHWAEIFVLCTSEGYLACFAFALLCVITNTAQEPPEVKPLANLKDKHPALGTFVTFLCQFLSLLIPVVINIMLYYVPSRILIPVIGIFVYYCGILCRFQPEPAVLMFAWRRSNLCFALGLVRGVVAAAKDVGEIKHYIREFYTNYVRDYVSVYIYLIIFVAVFLVVLLAQTIASFI